ncbi:ATP-binding protein [Rhodococcus sp. D2-41]|uniref:ATP-binding protein n=1 Tax=Speluncibacter jeojiensis TaxID=2710754 RepID=UPI0024106CC8|nr:ATP-binding protein [Rhodococcus sp. D2-41]MDG3010800.1 ATP-binding protein [Rhodococcus sp. D2-41]
MRVGSPVEFTVPADAGHLPVVRAIAEAICLTAGCDLDQTADIKLAMDEACCNLLAGAVHGSQLVCTFEGEAAAMRVSITSTEATTTPVTTGFGWFVLESLTDSVGTAHSPGTPMTATITFTRAGDGDR